MGKPLQPKKICSQIGLCTFDGVRGVSMGIESVVEESNSRSSGFRDNAIVWMQNQLRQNQTQDIILRYVNQVTSMRSDAKPNGRICGRLQESFIVSSMPKVCFPIGDKVFELAPEEVNKTHQYHDIAL
ncbi:hypothetical protein V6N13_023417 [Hibiscus sabdariffa]